MAPTKQPPKGRESFRSHDGGVSLICSGTPFFIVCRKVNSFKRILSYSHNSQLHCSTSTPQKPRCEGIWCIKHDTAYIPHGRRFKKLYLTFHISLSFSRGQNAEYNLSPPRQSFSHFATVVSCFYKAFYFVKYPSPNTPSPEWQARVQPTVYSYILSMPVALRSADLSSSSCSLVLPTQAT